MESTKERIIVAADKLFYQNGFASTSFADIAISVGLSRGNFYHHFKSKDDILGAVIEFRKKRTLAMIEQWVEQGKTPIDRLFLFVEILIRNSETIRKLGCPVGTLCTELSKSNHHQRSNAAHIFEIFIDWMIKEFEALGLEENARKYALHLLMRSQGIATILNAFHDMDFVHTEVANAKKWIESLLSNEKKEKQ